MTGTGPRIAARGRLSWLDALRGLAAMAVVYFHYKTLVPIPYLKQTWEWVDVGKCGVVLFFMISGYIIPMSLERHGDLRKFWISRGFRLYPPFLLVTAVAVGLMATGATPLPNQLVQQPLSGVLAHGTMMQGLLGISNVVPVYWTLSYEMIFYLIVAGLFAFGVHRYSAWYATGLAALAVFAGPALPQALLTGGGDRRLTAVIGVTLVFAAAVACFLATSRKIVLVGAVLGVGMIGVAVINGGESSSRASWQSLILLATMFAGTTIYRMQHGQLRLLPGLGALAAVLLAATAGAWWHLADEDARRLWVAAIVLPAIVFGAGFLFRHREMPWVLRKLGELSYSIYLLHLVLLEVLLLFVPGVKTESAPVRLAALTGLLVVLFALSELVCRFVEKPAQRLGRRVAEPLGTRHDRAAAGLPVSRAVPAEAALKG